MAIHSSGIRSKDHRLYYVMPIQGGESLPKFNRYGLPHQSNLDESNAIQILSCQLQCQTPMSIANAYCLLHYLYRYCCFGRPETSLGLPPSPRPTGHRGKSILHRRGWRIRLDRTGCGFCTPPSAPHKTKRCRLEAPAHKICTTYVNSIYNGSITWFALARVFYTGFWNSNLIL